MNVKSLCTNIKTQNVKSAIYLRKQSKNFNVFNI